MTLIIFKITPLLTPDLTKFKFSSVVHTLPKMAIRFLVFFGILGVSIYSSRSQVLPEKENPLIQLAITTCRAKEECPENHFCEGKGTIKRCIECIDCTLHQRHPKKSYDGETCAKHHTECGECKAGYEDLGGVCMPKASPNPSADTISEFFEREEKLLNAEKSGGIYWASISIGLLSVVGISIAVICLKYYRKKKRENRNEEEAGLTSYNGPCGNPTAPPEEYSSQPTPYNPGYPNDPFLSSFGRQNIRPNRVCEQHYQAQPFNIGNGAGSWAQAEAADSEASDDTDTVDGAAASGPSDQPQSNDNVIDIRTNNPTPTHTDNAQDRRSRTVVGEIGLSHPDSNSRQPQNQVAIQSPMEPQSQHMDGLPQQGAYNIQANQLFANIDFAIYFHAFVSRQSGPTNQNAGSQSPSSRLISSAPTSPRRIDDTHAIDLTVLQEPFLSNVSLDSGTGTNDHDRPVPSRAASGGFSDFDESGMYDDDMSSPFSPPQPVEVPDADSVPDIDEPMDED